MFSTHREMGFEPALHIGIDQIRLGLRDAQEVVAVSALKLIPINGPQSASGSNDDGESAHTENLCSTKISELLTVERIGCGGPNRPVPQYNSSTVNETIQIVSARGVPQV
jgi:hypothetical protein